MRKSLFYCFLLIKFYIFKVTIHVASAEIPLLICYSKYLKILINSGTYFHWPLKSQRYVFHWLNDIRWDLLLFQPILLLLLFQSETCSYLCPQTCFSLRSHSRLWPMPKYRPGYCLLLPQAVLRFQLFEKSCLSKLHSFWFYSWVLFWVYCQSALDFLAIIFEQMKKLCKSCHMKRFRPHHRT